MGLFSKTNKNIGSGSDIEGADSRKGFYWVEDQKGENVMWRLPRNVMWNDNVLVREDEYGIFFRDGKALTVFDRPDRYYKTSLFVIVGITFTMPCPDALWLLSIGEIYFNGIICAFCV